MEEIMNGFTFYLHGKDYFIETKQVNKTRKLVEKILPFIGASITDGNIDCLLHKMRKATCKICTCNDTDRKEKRYYEISGENFGGLGSWVNDGETIVLNLEKMEFNKLKPTDE